jgi:carbonic anhydrase/acetyltransferase-like protein (isoleucine patch superfamily)
VKLLALQELRYHPPMPSSFAGATPDRPLLLPLLGVTPAVGAGLRGSPTARIIGRSRVGTGCTFGADAVLRADGDSIEVGDRCWFGDRATVHIVHSAIPARLGADITVGHSALVHAAQIDAGTVVCAGAVVMDAARVGPGAVIAESSLVPPRKTLEGGWLYAGVPAVPIRPLREGELERIRQAERVRSAPTPAAPAGDFAPGEVLLPSAGRAFVADNVHLESTARLAAGATLWFGTTISGREGTLIVGVDSNVQDNTVIALEGKATLEIGHAVTVGHNATLEAGRIEDGALVGMGARMGRGAVIEEGACLAGGAMVAPGTVVTRGMLWAGRPAHPVRPVTETERTHFARGVRVYCSDYLDAYLRSS